MTNSLLEKARSLDRKSPAGRQEIPVTKEECEMFIELLHGELTVRQYSQALGFEGRAGSISHRSLTIVRKGIQNGWLTLTFNR